MFSPKIGIDLGTCNSMVFRPNTGVVLQEPTVVAVVVEDNAVVAIGNEAKTMLGRTPDTIVAYRPLRDGVIADFRVTEAMLRYFYRKVLGNHFFFKPEVLIGIPAGATSTEKRAVLEAALRAGAKEAFIAKEPVLSAIGAGIPINSASGNMIIDIGGGTSEIAVISLGGVVASNSVRIGGDKFDAAIESYIREKYNLAVGEQTAEKIKIHIGTALPLQDNPKMEIRGRDLLAGLPKNIVISANEVCEAIQGYLFEILQAVKEVLKTTPPEISADIMDKGIVMAGGGSLLRKMDEYIFQGTGVPTVRAKDPITCVARGTGIVLEHLDEYKKSIMRKK